MTASWDWWYDLDLDQIRDEVGEAAYSLAVRKRLEHLRRVRKSIADAIAALERL